MNLNKKISIIVPIYKVEQFLCRCVDSILNQTYRNLEIFLVDDGSPDKCGLICDDYAEKDSRIKVIHKLNGGLSDARNVALDLVSGEFVMFVDSDDWIEPNACEDLMELLNQFDADIVSFGMVEIYQSGQKKCKFANYPRIITPSYGIQCMISFNEFVGNFAWNKIYKTALFSGIRYPKGMLYEDQGTTYKVFNKAKKIYLCDKVLYYYWQRNDSITGNWFLPVAIKARIKLWLERLEFLKEHYPELVQFQTAQLLGDIRIGLIKLRQEPEYNSFKDFAERFIKENHPNMGVLPRYSRKLKLLYKFYPAFYLYVKYIL